MCSKSLSLNNILLMLLNIAYSFSQYAFSETHMLFLRRICLFFEKNSFFPRSLSQVQDLAHKMEIDNVMQAKPMVLISVFLLSICTARQLEVPPHSTAVQCLQSLGIARPFKWMVNKIQYPIVSYLPFRTNDPLVSIVTWSIQSYLLVQLYYNNVIFRRG